VGTRLKFGLSEPKRIKRWRRKDWAVTLRLDEGDGRYSRRVNIRLKGTEYRDLLRTSQRSELPPAVFVRKLLESRGVIPEHGDQYAALKARGPMTAEVRRVLVPVLGL
jgi:hypothetical protein